MFFACSPSHCFQSKKQAKLTSLWVDSDDDDCILLDPLPPSCNSTNKKGAVSSVKVGSTKVCLYSKSIYEQYQCTLLYIPLKHFFALKCTKILMLIDVF